MQLDKPQPIRLLTTIARNSITHSRYMWQKCSHAKTHLRYMWHFPLHRWVQNVVSIPLTTLVFGKLPHIREITFFNGTNLPHIRKIVFSRRTT